MNTRKLRKAILTLCSALLLVSLSVGATLAYLTSQDSVVNTFTVGKVGLSLDETDVWDKDDKYIVDGKEVPVTKEMIGTPKTDTTNRTDDANDYQLYPNKEYTKDPTIHVDANSEDCWVTAKITVTADNIEEVRGLIGYDSVYLGFDGILKNGVFNDDYTFTTVDGIATWTGTNYTLTQKPENDKNVFYVFVNAPQKAGANITLFDTIVIPNTWTNDDLAKLAGLKMDISAYAVQMDGFTNAQAAFAAGFPND